MGSKDDTESDSKVSREPNPSAGLSPKPERKRQSVNALPSVTNMPSTSHTSSPNGPLPPGWKSGVDPQSGKTYYVNPSGISQWAKPTLPPGWKSGVDPQSGKTYYVNPSGISQWAKPTRVTPN